MVDLKKLLKRILNANKKQGKVSHLSCYLMSSLEGCHWRAWDGLINCNNHTLTSFSEKTNGFINKTPITKVLKIVCTTYNIIKNGVCIKITESVTSNGFEISD